MKVGRSPRDFWREFFIGESMNGENCWEVKKCGRQCGGVNAYEIGVCPSAMPNDHNGLNGGRFAGRFCWAVAGTYCGGKSQGTHAAGIVDCTSCDFFWKVQREEGSAFVLSPQDAKRKFKEIPRGPL
jgi:hypothetical protein